MITDDYFRRALKHKIKEKGLLQRDIAEALSFRGSQLSEYLSEKRGFSEERKEIIAEFFKMSLLDMLLLGKDLCEGKDPEKKEPAPEQKSNEDSTYLKEIIKEMKWLVESLRLELDRKENDVEKIRKENEILQKKLEEKESENRQLLKREVS